MFSPVGRPRNTTNFAILNEKVRYLQIIEKEVSLVADIEHQIAEF